MPVWAGEPRKELSRIPRRLPSIGSRTRRSCVEPNSEKMREPMLNRYGQQGAPLGHLTPAVRRGTRRQRLVKLGFGYPAQRLSSGRR